MGYFRRAKSFAHVLDPTTIMFSFLEGAVAYFWLLVVRHDDWSLFGINNIWLGGFILFFGLGFEHVIQGSLLGLEDDPNKKLPTN